MENNTPTLVRIQSQDEPTHAPVVRQASNLVELKALLESEGINTTESQIENELMSGQAIYMTVDCFSEELFRIDVRVAA